VTDAPAATRRAVRVGLMARIRYPFSRVPAEAADARRRPCVTAS
jgi:hypothetical protein